MNRPSSYTVQYIAIKWLFCVIIAIGTALTAFTINLMVENIAGMKFSFTFMAMEKSYFAGRLQPAAPGSPTAHEVLCFRKSCEFGHFGLLCNRRRVLGFLLEPSLSG